MSQNADFYGYLPSKPAALFGISYFSAATIICTAQIAFGRYRHLWVIMLVVAAIGETIGWGARLWAHSSPTDWMPYMIQICSLGITPVIISATDYVFFCVMIQKLDVRLFSMPNWFYWVFFVICDLISLAIQTVGGVEVSSAQDLASIDHGGRVMLAGIIFQFSNTVVFIVLVLVAMLMLRRKRATLLDAAEIPALVALWISTLMLLLRNGYRIVELRGGWEGHVMRTEIYLIAFDMVPIAVAIGVFLVFSPSYFFRPRRTNREPKARKSRRCRGC